LGDFLNSLQSFFNRLLLFVFLIIVVFIVAAKIRVIADSLNTTRDPPDEPVPLFEKKKMRKRGKTLEGAENIYGIYLRR
jgi:hypothetical protein